MNASTATRNERWSPVTNVPLNETFGSRFSPHTKKNPDCYNDPSPKPTRNSHNLRSILRQDFGDKGMSSMVNKGSRQHPLVRPNRKASVECLRAPASMNSYDSMSTISSSESLSSLNNKNSRWGGRSSKNNLLKYSNMESKGSLASLNNRWRATPKASNRKTNGIKPNNNSCYSTLSTTPVQSNLGPTGGRWMASLSSEKASDQPICMITRKSSASYLPTASTAA